jgi:hypothetical protein
MPGKAKNQILPFSLHKEQSFDTLISAHPTCFALLTYKVVT